MKRRIALCLAVLAIDFTAAIPLFLISQIPKIEYRIFLSTTFFLLLINGMLYDYAIDVARHTIVTAKRLKELGYLIIPHDNKTTIPSSPITIARASIETPSLTPRGHLRHE